MWTQRALQRQREQQDCKIRHHQKMAKSVSVATRGWKAATDVAVSVEAMPLVHAWCVWKKNKNVFSCNRSIGCNKTLGLVRWYCFEDFYFVHDADNKEIPYKISTGHGHILLSIRATSCAPESRWAVLETAVIDWQTWSEFFVTQSSNEEGPTCRYTAPRNYNYINENWVRLMAASMNARKRKNLLTRMLACRSLSKADISTATFYSDRLPFGTIRMLAHCRTGNKSCVTIRPSNVFTWREKWYVVHQGCITQW